MGKPQEQDEAVQDQEKDQVNGQKKLQYEKERHPHER